MLHRLPEAVLYCHLAAPGRLSLLLLVLHCSVLPHQGVHQLAQQHLLLAVGTASCPLSLHAWLAAGVLDGAGTALHCFLAATGQPGLQLLLLWSSVRPSPHQAVHQLAQQHLLLAAGTAAAASRLLPLQCWLAAVLVASPAAAKPQLWQR